MALNYSSKHDISYASYNNKTIPWKVNTSIISQNNQNTNPSLNLGTINNNLVIESSQNDILFITSQNDNDNKKVIVKNNMDVDANLDVSNNLTTKLNVSYDISLNNILYFPSLPVNIIGDLKVRGAISVLGEATPGLVKSESQFVNVTLSGSRFTDVSIVSSTISVTDFSNVNIINSYINDIPNGFGYDKSNNALPNKAIFSDVSLQRLILDSSINSSYINFANNTSNAISIRSSADYSKLVISKPLNVGTETITNISNVSIFYGDISCNNLYYSRLVPDVKLNNYSDVSIGEVSISGNNVPTSNIGINIGSNAYKFNNTYSTNFNGDLSGQATLANNLIKNLDMSFNNLDICGTITLNKLNLNQFLSSDLTSIVDGNYSFITISNKVRDLSAIVYSKSDFDLCLNTHFTKISLLETSFIALNGNITSISNSVYSKSDFDLSLNTYITKISLLETSFVRLNGNLTSISNSVYSKSDFDLCLNRNILRISDVSAIVTVVSSPPNIYPTLGYNDNLSIKQTNAKVSNELAFPYAITYIDDITEDTNMRESLALIAASQNGSIVVSATAIGVTYEINSNVQTWEWHRTNAISSGRSLAVILNATQNEQARVVASAANPSSAPFIGALRTSKPNPPNLNNTSEYWQWVTGATWSYTNFNNGEPNNIGGEPYIELLYWAGSGVWNDITSNVSKPAVYMNTYGIGNGSFKISENNNNKSYYIKSSASVLPSTISTTYSCIAITNDGMFVALGKATNVTIYMKNSSAWQTLGTPINVDFSRYTDTSCNILLDGYDPAMYSNLQNLAINFNYFSGSTSSQLILAFGDSRTSIKVYSYSGGSWSFSNGSYSVAGGTWGSTFLRAHNATTAEINSNNFGYFVTLSQSPSILGFTVANNFYTYNCTTSDGSQRGTVQTLVSSHNYYTNIIAFKMSSDADKIIVSNNYYVFIYKWNINTTNWTLLTTINLVSANIRTDIPDSQITGGTIGTSGLNTIYSFTTVGTSTFVPVFSGIVQVLIVGGGGGGGRGLGGGGGGGGVVYIPSVSVSAGTIYNITVGAGGISETKGENSSAFTAIAAGGGRGGTYLSSNGGNGGCGGGAGTNDEPYVAQQGGISSGNSPGTNSNAIVHGTNGGSLVITPGANNTRSPGGGGAGAAGLNTDQTAITSGGQGIMYDILGTSYYWAGGGGGSIWGGTSAGSGGLGGGGGGGASNGVLVGSGGGSALNIGFPGNNGPGNGGPGGAGGANTGGGGGGGGGNSAGGAGGSGIVVIRYIPVGPRSLDISNISSDECVFAIGFPDKLIDTSSNRKARGYVEYWKYSNAIATRLATLVPRKRNIDNSNVDIDEYFFSAGGIKITNANTILVAPNFKFHLSSTNKIYTLSQNSLNWATHNNSSNAKAIVGREIASIENEADNELVKVSARNNNVWIGATRISNISTGITSSDWAWSDPSSIWNYTSFNSGEPNRFAETRIQSLSGTWYDTDQFITMKAVYMTRLQYSLNTFTIFNNFFLHLSGFSSSYANTDIASAVIAKWVRTDSPSTQPIEFRGNGNIMRNSQGSFTTSDIRLKENIVDASPKLVDLLKVRVVNYNLKGSDGTKLIGVVAQELETLFPTLVNNGELSPHDTYLGKTESYKSVKYSCFDVILIKAFQEQMAIINKLSAQLDDLECKTKLLKTISQEHAILKQDLEFLKRENELFKLNINEITMLMAKC